MCTIAYESSNVQRCYVASIEAFESNGVAYATVYFVPVGASKLMASQMPQPRFNIFCPKGQKPDEYFSLWQSEAEEHSEVMYIGTFSVEVDEKFVRLNEKGDPVKNSDGKIAVFTTVTIYDFANEDGTAVFPNRVCKRAQSLLANSKQLMTIEAYKTMLAVQKQAKPAPSLAGSAEVGDDELF